MVRFACRFPSLTTRLFFAAAAGVLVAGCHEKSDRNPVPAALVDHVTVPGFDEIRFWGDKDTPVFDDAMKRQFSELKAAAENGKLPNADKVTSVVAISGGGDQGAFAAGYLKGWSDRGDRPRFDIVTGVSTGALAAPFTFLGPSHDDELRKIYTENGADQLYDTRWDFGLFGDALKDTEPLRKTIERYVTDAFLDEIAAQYRLGRRLLVATTNLDAQRPVIWDLSAIAASDSRNRQQLFVDLLLATSAVPGIFPPVKIRVKADDGRMYDELHADGSVSMQMFFLPPQIKLTETEKAIFGKARQRTLYVLRNGKLAPEYATTDDQAVALLQRGVNTLVKAQVVANLRLLEKAAKDSETHFKFMGIPKALENPSKTKFDKAYAMRLFEAARASGLKQEWVNKAPETPELTPATGVAAEESAER